MRVTVSQLAFVGARHAVPVVELLNR